MRTSRWRWESDERVAAVARDAFGYPRLAQARESRIGTLAFLLGLGAVVSASVLVFWVTR